MYLMVHAVVLNGDVSYEVLSCYSTRMPTHKLTVNIHTHTQLNREHHKVALNFSFQGVAVCVEYRPDNPLRNMDLWSQRLLRGEFILLTHVVSVRNTAMG